MAFSEPLSGWCKYLCSLWSFVCVLETLATNEDVSRAFGLVQWRWWGHKSKEGWFVLRFVGLQWWSKGHTLVGEATMLEVQCHKWGHPYSKGIFPFFILRKPKHETYWQCNITFLVKVMMGNNQNVQVLNMERQVARYCLNISWEAYYMDNIFVLATTWAC